MNFDALALGTYDYALTLGKDGHPDDKFMKEWYAMNKPVPKDLLKELMDEPQSLPTHAWKAIGAGVSAVDLTPYCSYFNKDIPILVLAGSEDAFFPAKVQAKVKKAFPQAKYIPYDGYGHNIELENPEQFAKDCIEFFPK